MRTCMYNQGRRCKTSKFIKIIVWQTRTPWTEALTLAIWLTILTREMVTNSLHQLVLSGQTKALGFSITRSNSLATVLTALKYQLITKWETLWNLNTKSGLQTLLFRTLTHRFRCSRMFISRGFKIQEFYILNRFPREKLRRTDLEAIANLQASKIIIMSSPTMFYTCQCSQARFLSK